MGWRARWRQVRVALWVMGIVAGLTFPVWGQWVHNRLVHHDEAGAGHQ